MHSSSLRGSLRIRLLLGTLFWITATILAAGWGLGSLFRQHVESQFHAELKTHLDQLTAHLTLDEGGHPMLRQPLSEPRLTRPYSGLYWQIDGVATATEPAVAGLLRSRSLWDYVLNVPKDDPDDGEIHQHRLPGPDGAMLGMIERTVRLGDVALRLIVAADERLMVEPAARFEGKLWLSLGMLGAGLVIAALVQVFVGLAPLRRMRTALGRVRDGTTQRLEGKFPVEIMPLVDELNAVLEQNAEVVERARTQAGNLAHALKTPLSSLANTAARNRDDRDSELAQLVLEHVSIARNQVDYHLARARAAATVRIPGAKTLLRPVTEGLVRVMQRIHADREIELTIDSMPDDLAFRGEEQDLQEMLGNLLDNACKWASRHVALQAVLEHGKLIIVIDDDGKGLDPAQRDAMIRRGARADERVPGSGLGLAIADDLARMYGGLLELASSASGGLRVKLTLPAV